jgi:hypothetical protein
MQWPQIVVLIEFVIWLAVAVCDVITDRKLSHAGAVVLMLIVIGLIASNVLVLSAGGFW